MDRPELAKQPTSDSDDLLVLKHPRFDYHVRLFNTAWAKGMISEDDLEVFMDPERLVEIVRGESAPVIVEKVVEVPVPVKKKPMTLGGFLWRSALYSCAGLGAVMSVGMVFLMIGLHNTYGNRPAPATPTVVAPPTPQQLQTQVTEKLHGLYTPGWLEVDMTTAVRTSLEPGGVRVTVLRSDIDTQSLSTQLTRNRYEVSEISENSFLVTNKK